MLDAYAFIGLDEIRALTELWMEEYNHGKPNEALENLTPMESIKALKSTKKAYHLPA